MIRCPTFSGSVFLHVEQSLFTKIKGFHSKGKFHGMLTNMNVQFTEAMELCIW